MKKYIDLRWNERTFRIEKWVYIQLQLYQQQKLAQRKNMKLSPQFYGPFPILECVDVVACRLDLSKSTQIYSIFHVSLLKKKLGWVAQSIPHLLPIDSMGVIKVEPKAILDMRVRKNGTLPITEVLVHWQGQMGEDSYGRTSTSSKTLTHTLWVICFEVMRFATYQSID